MIVADDTVSKALAYLADDPHPIALARKAVEDTEAASKRAYAAAFLSVNGPVKERECYAETETNHIAAKAEEAEAIQEHERHKARVKAAENIISVWQSENANARAAERVR